MRTCALLIPLAVAATLAAPAFAQTSAGSGTNVTIRQPNGAVVPVPSERLSTSAQAGATLDSDPTVTGSIRSRDTVGMRQSPETRNAFGCPQIDPLCQSGR